MFFLSGEVAILFFEPAPSASQQCTYNIGGQFMLGTYDCAN